MINILKDSRLSSGMDTIFKTRYPSNIYNEDLLFPSTRLEKESLETQGISHGAKSIPQCQQSRILSGSLIMEIIL